MPKYKECEALIEFVKKHTPNINGETTMKCVERAIRKAPAADVEEVVFCKDCKHLYCCSAVDRMFYCRHHKGMHGVLNPIEENPYCSYGERKEENNA